MVEDISDESELVRSLRERWEADARESMRLDETGCWAPKGHTAWGPGEVIARLRMTLRLSQSDISWRSGVAQPQISKLEAGRDAHWSMIARLAEALECDAALRLKPRRSLNEMRLENIKGFY